MVAQTLLIIFHKILRLKFQLSSGVSCLKLTLSWPSLAARWLRQKEKRAAENEMVREHQQLHRNEYEQTPGDSEGQGSLACCSPWGCKESDTTKQLNNDY